MKQMNIKPDDIFKYKNNPNQILEIVKIFDNGKYLISINGYNSSFRSKEETIIWLSKMNCVKIEGGTMSIKKGDVFVYNGDTKLVVYFDKQFSLVHGMKISIVSVNDRTYECIFDSRNILVLGIHIDRDKLHYMLENHTFTGKFSSCED